jgi:DNA-binding NtrC family response regulator
MTSHILLVDDDDKIRDVLSCLLMELGHEVKTASGPEEARELVNRTKFHLAFIDNHLGSTRGTDLIPVLAGLDRDLRFVLMSGTSDIEMAEDAIGKGVSGFLRKPFRVEEVLLCIDHASWRKKIEQRMKRLKSDGNNM